MRMIPATPRLLLFLKHIRPYCKKLVYEFPTYPYDMEMAKQKGIARKVCYHMDRICRHGLKRYIDRAVTFSTNATIFGMKAMSIVNGIGVSDFPEHRPPADRNSITLICVAKLSKWHGFDRLIQGLAVYLKAQNQAAHRVEIEIVGAGEALDSLKALVEQRGLHENVHFHGILVGDTLNDLFAHADIAVESLGLHRIGCSVSSTLKSREYMARGIPFIYSAIIPGIENQPWALKFSPDDCPVDIDQIVSWYEHLPKDQTALLMRAYAEMHLSWESQLSKIIQAL
jgi:glycosyltransferase involved in cell wall biosynthesis